LGGAALLCASALYLTALLLSPPLVGLYNDDGIYIGSALSLARGEGYRIPHLPGSPLQAKYPPLYPVILVPIAWIVGDNPTATGLYRWPSVLATLGALALLPGLFRRWGLSEQVAVGAAVLSVLSPMVFQHSLFALSEPVFLLLTIATFRLLPTGEAASSTRAVPAALCATAAVLCRSIGIALIPALALSAWSRRRQPGAWIPFAGAAMAAILWSAASAWMRAIEENRRLGSLYDYYLGYFHFVPGRLSDLVTIVSTNAYEVWFSLGDLFLGWRWVNLATGFWAIPPLILGAFAVLAWRELLRGDAAAAVYVITSAALILVWPYSPVRFLIPLTPFIVAAAFLAIERRFRNLANVHRVSYGLVLIGMVSCLIVDVTRFPSSKLQIGMTAIDPGPFNEAAAWLKTHSEPDDVVISDHDPWVFLATGRRALPPGTTDPLWGYGRPVDSAAWSAAWTESRRYKARWLILTDLWDSRFRELWTPHLRSDRDTFELRYENKTIAIFALHPHE
jgi:hypothetical protein